MKKIDIDWKHLRSTYGWMLKENASVDIIRSADAIENSIRRKRLIENKTFFASKYAGDAYTVLDLIAIAILKSGSRDYLYKFEESAFLFELEQASTGGEQKFCRNVDRAKEIISKHNGLLLAGGGRAIETAIKELKEEGMAIKYHRKINNYWEV